MKCPQCNAALAMGERMKKVVSWEGSATCLEGIEGPCSSLLKRVFL